MTVLSCLRGYLDYFWPILWYVKGLFCQFYGRFKGSFDWFYGLI